MNILLLFICLWTGLAQATEAGYCATCAHKRHHQRGGAAHRCPNLEPVIAAIAPGQVSCYSSLFSVESSCSTTVKHDQRVTHNPHAGIGLCAIEKDPYIRAGRGPACHEIGSTAGQVRCCVSLMRTTGGAYFGTVLSGKTPRCG